MHVTNIAKNLRWACKVCHGKDVDYDKLFKHTQSIFKNPCKDLKELTDKCNGL